ncbi:MAG TPA: hypothetical protein VIQ03_13710 [Gammaproteobacteria bacterium]
MGLFQTRRILFILSLLTFIMLSSACGKTGDLYLPDETPEPQGTQTQQ